MAFGMGLNQVVYLDFFSGTDGSISYSSSRRSQIQNQIEEKFSRFGVSFTQSRPSSGDYSTVTFNAGNPGGATEFIDFRNLDKNDSCVVNIDGLAVSGTTQIINASATVGAHELGHLLGLRHGDAFGPIGSGLGSGGPLPATYVPRFPGPSLGDETDDHVMGSPVIGADNLTRVTWLSERAATKLQFAIEDRVLLESPGPKSTRATAQPLPLDNMIVPNTILNGDNAGIGDFSVDAVNVLGQLSQNGEADLYRFQASAGDLFNIEVMSNVLEHRYANTIDPQISVLDANGDIIPYWGDTTVGALNEAEFESFDSILIDLRIPANGTYYLQVDHWGNVGTGSYELFAYRFNGGLAGAFGDFNRDGDYGCADIDSLVATIATGENNLAFDLTGDGQVNHTDLDVWLAVAGSVNLGPGSRYLGGDANLDGNVDVSDINIWYSNRFANTAAWCLGDFTADGVVDVSDFNVLNINQFRSSDSGTQQVPEPSGWLWLFSFLVCLGVRRPTVTRRTSERLPRPKKIGMSTV